MNSLETQPPKVANLDLELDDEDLEDAMKKDRRVRIMILKLRKLRTQCNLDLQRIRTAMLELGYQRWSMKKEEEKKSHEKIIEKDYSFS